MSPVRLLTPVRCLIENGCRHHPAQGPRPLRRRILALQEGSALGVRQEGERLGVQSLQFANVACKLQRCCGAKDVHIPAVDVERVPDHKLVGTCIKRCACYMTTAAILALKAQSSSKGDRTYKDTK